MADSPYDALGRQYAWDSTSIKYAEECLYKYKLAMLEGWQPESKSVHLLFGGWYATALEHFHKHRAAGMEWVDAVETVVLEALVNTWEHERDEAGERLPDTGSAWESDHNTKTRENLIRTIIWYLDQFEDDAAKTVILSNGQAAVEYSFTINVDNGITFSGHLDRLVEYAGHIYVQDQKTTGNTITQKFFEGFSPDTQMSMYTFAGKMLYNIPVHGVIIDGAQIAVGFSRFERGFAWRTADQLDEWYTDTMYHIEAARKAVEENYFPMNRSSCGNYGGCEFRSICSKSPVVRQQYLKGTYVQRTPWNPLEKR